MTASIRHAELLVPVFYSLKKKKRYRNIYKEGLRIRHPAGKVNNIKFSKQKSIEYIQ